MTARPTEPSHDALSAEERELAARLARLDASSGPSAALDARILAAARSATAPRVISTPRRVRRWPGAVGAAAVFVVAVGLAWQLRPMFQLPAPVIHAEHAGDGRGAGAEADTVVQVETVPRRDAPAVAPVQSPTEIAPQTAPAAAARKAVPAAGGGVPATQNRAPTSASARLPTHDFVDEAVPPPPPPPPAPAAVSEPAPEAFSAAPASNAAADAAAVSGVAAQKAEMAPRAERRVATVAPAAAPDVSADARLPTRDWIARIRERRDAGDTAGARASLARFVIAHPRVAVPTDLRPLLPADDPWSP